VPGSRCAVGERRVREVNVAYGIARRIKLSALGIRDCSWCRDAVRCVVLQRKALVHGSSAAVGPPVLGYRPSIPNVQLGRLHPPRRGLGVDLGIDRRFDRAQVIVVQIDEGVSLFDKACLPC
jgi:hypothetical protein